MDDSSGFTDEKLKQYQEELDKGLEGNAALQQVVFSISILLHMFWMQFLQLRHRL